MGLDMYLRAVKYVSSREWGDFNQENPEFRRVLEAVGAENVVEPGSFSGITVTIPIMYWRKANAIHRWFVAECQNGRDECQETFVSREKLVELRDTCRQVLDGTRKPQVALPTQSGFFFGSTSYDEEYRRDLAYTADRLDEVLKLFPEKETFFDFVYQSSW